VKATKPFEADPTSRLQQTARVMEAQLAEMLTTLDDNLTGPLCRDYIGWLPDADKKSDAWRSISYVVDGLPSSKKFDIARALLVTWRNTDINLGADGTAWGHIVMEAAEHAGDKQDRSTPAEQLISAVVLHSGKSGPCIVSLGLIII
jgi:hypothetical protein